MEIPSPYVLVQNWRGLLRLLAYINMPPRRTGRNGTRARARARSLSAENTIHILHITLFQNEEHARALQYLDIWTSISSIGDLMPRERERERETLLGNNVPKRGSGTATLAMVKDM